MVRGTTLFICTQCKKVFLAPDIEYDAMCLSVPMPCERCGSRRTLPMKLDLFAFSDKLNPNKPLKEQLLYYSSYEEIWKRMPSVHIEQGGTPDEQYRIGMEYLNGTRLSYHDSDIAFYWLMKAARRGHVRAQYQVGRLLRHRPPVPKYLQNPPFCYTEGTAYQWMTQAAGQGLPEAMCGLANMVGKYNPKKAFALHMKAAMSGCAESEYAIACLYEQGEGVEQNPFRALRWCRALLYSINSLRYVRLYCEMTPSTILRRSSLPSAMRAASAGDTSTSGSSPMWSDRRSYSLRLRLNCFFCRRFMPQ